MIAAYLKFDISMNLYSHSPFFFSKYPLVHKHYYNRITQKSLL